MRWALLAVAMKGNMVDSYGLGVKCAVVVQKFIWTLMLQIMQEMTMGQVGAQAGNEHMRVRVHGGSLLVDTLIIVVIVGLKREFQLHWLPGSTNLDSTEVRCLL